MIIKWQYGKEEFEDAKEIRRKVFIEEQNVDESIEQDSIDSRSYHIVIYKDNFPVGTGRVFEEGNTYIFGRVSVLTEFRGFGYGELIIREILAKIKELGGIKVEIHSQKNVEMFYKRLGFRSTGEYYLEAGIEHVNMSIELK